MSLQIREYKADDLASLAYLMTELGYPTSIGEMKIRIRQLQECGIYTTLIAELNGCVVGMAGLLLGKYYEKNGYYVRIVALIVVTQYRKQGIGKALLEKTEVWAREKGVTTVVLNSGNRPERKAAHDFYRRLGYRDRSIGFYKEIKA